MTRNGTCKLLLKGLSLELYHYVYNNPVRFVDFNGLSAIRPKNIKLTEVLMMLLDPAAPLAVDAGCRSMGFSNSKVGTDGETNALRHCINVCCLAKMKGPEYAKLVSDANEYGQNDADSKADKNNNGSGIGLAPKCKKAKNCNLRDRPEWH